MEIGKFMAEGCKTSIMNIALWIIQILLALLFLFAGGMKLIMPIEEMTQQIPMPGLFLRFIGVCEVLGGLGLVLPWLLGIRPGLTPLAAAGLVIIMVGATVTTIATGQIAISLVPLVVGILCLFVVYGRWRLAPPRELSRG
jgi:uncharacterized membrane protein YphA (DoxX/SURF4 family)